MTVFTWDRNKEIENILKHGVDFNAAKKAFEDPHRRITHDLKHSLEENRFFCVGKVANAILTVRFTYRENEIRIIGAGAWRKGKKLY